MLESTIEEVLNKDPITSKIFLGCFASNELPLKPKYPSCFVVNTKPRNHPGEHWVAINYDSSGSCFFFDSFAQTPSKYNFESYIKSTSTAFSYNKKRLQGLSNFCGLYCLLYLLFATRKKTNTFFKKFSSNYFKNDNLIKKLLDDF